MTVFGQSVPALPKVYLDLTERTFTKVGFLSHLVRALETVGMVPIRSVWPWDPIESPEFAVVDPTVAVFPFDYPDTSTFTVNSVVYRPCLAVCCWIGETNSASTTLRNGQRLGILEAIRLNGNFDINQMTIMNKTRTPAASNFGFTAESATAYPQVNAEGGYVEFLNWKPHAASASVTDTNLLNVKHWFTYLGPAGLFLYVGSGTSESQLGSHLACGWAFGGGRIPGRELSPDPNLNRINPVFPLYLKASGNGNSQYDTSTTPGIYRTLIHGIQHDLKATLTPVRARLLNLENTELPFYPTYRPNTVPSPRVVAGGEGAHILGRVIIVPTQTENDVADFYAPIVAEIRTDDVQPSFGQVFTCPKLTFSDFTAPIGVREDPTTLDDWYMMPTYNSLHRLGLFFENGITVSALATTVLTTVGTDSYTMAGPGGNGFTFPNLSGGLTAPSTALTGDGVPTAVTWNDALNTGQVPPESNDQMVALINTAGGTNREAEITWTILLDSAHPADTVYTIQFGARNRNDATTLGSNPLYFEVFHFGAWVRLLTLNSAGTNTGLPEYNYQTFNYNVLLDTTAPSLVKRIQVRWIANKIGSLFGNTITVREVKIIRKRYL